MTRRNRVLGFGGCLLALLLGPIVGTLVGGVTGEAMEIALASLGGIALVSLVFLEIGLSEDRERARSSPGAPPASTASEEDERAPERPVEGERDRPARLSRSPRPRRRRP
jgi:hypothetical protein